MGEQPLYPVSEIASSSKKGVADSVPGTSKVWNFTFFLWYGQRKKKKVEAGFEVLSCAFGARPCSLISATLKKLGKLHYPIPSVLTQ